MSFNHREPSLSFNHREPCPLITGIHVCPLITGNHVCPLITGNHVCPLITGNHVCPLITENHVYPVSVIRCGDSSPTCTTNWSVTVDWETAAEDVWGVPCALDMRRDPDVSLLRCPTESVPLCARLYDHLVPTVLTRTPEGLHVPFVHRTHTTLKITKQREFSGRLGVVVCHCQPQ